MKTKLFLVVAAFLSTLTAQANAARTWTVTTVGTIESGYDYTGVFGVAERNLAGLSYVQSITASVDPSKWETEYADAEVASLQGAGPGFYVTVTVGSYSASFSSTSTGWGRQEISNNQYVDSIHPPRDKVDTYQLGTTTDGNAFSAVTYVSSSNNFVPTTSFSQNISQYTQGAAFSTSSVFGVNGFQRAGFSGSVTHLGVREGEVIPTIPEPETYAMLIAGLGMISFAARRKRTAA